MAIFMTRFTVACVQLTANNDIEQNLAVASQLVREAAALGADFITLPENATIMEESGKNLKGNTPLHSEHPVLDYFCALANELNTWLLIGSIPVSVEHDEKLANRCYMINAQGQVVVHYDKMHLFDAQLHGGESYTESNRYLAGNQVVVTDTPWAKMGLTICYDVRFPYLFRALAKQGAECITVPAAFAYTTGKDHWHVLLRARAIETGSYIIAPAQCGTHPGGRKTFGHSLIIDPWGHIIAEAGEDPCVITAEINTEKVKEVRSALPTLKHDKPIDLLSDS